MENKIPFKPREGEMYWTYIGDWTPHEEFWDGDAYDCIHKACGCVFRTKEEALKARPERYKALTGMDWSVEDACED